MAKISLSSYTVRLKDNRTDTYLRLDDFLPRKDFLDFVQEFFNFIEVQLSKDEETKKIIRVNNQRVKTNHRQLFGIIETGEYGFESEIIDSKKGTAKYKRTVDDAEMLPFYFLMSLPKGKDVGIILLQRFGLYGISKIFQTSLNKFLKSKNPEITLEFNPLVSTKVVEQYLEEGAVTKLVFRKFEIPSDLTDYFDTKDLRQVKGYVEYRIVATRNHNLPIKGRLRKFLTGKTQNRLMEIKNFDYNRLKVEVRFGNDTRTIDLDNFNSFRAYYDVSGDVRTGKNGHPTFESIDEAGRKLLKQLNALLYPHQNVE